MKHPLIPSSCAVLFGFCVPLLLHAAPLKQAKVTQVINDVNLLPSETAARRATVNDDVNEGTAVRTGVESRSELTFTDQTLARLGANTIFTFNEGTRSMELGSGAMLLRVPKNAGGAKITTAAVTAAITGTTVMMQYDPEGYAKFIVLEGTACMFLKNKPNDCVAVHAGELLTVRVKPSPSSLPVPVSVDLKKLMDTSALLSAEFAPLPSLDLIAPVVEEQKRQTEDNDGAVADNSSHSGSKTVFAAMTDLTTAIDQRNAVEELTSAPPSPTPVPVTPTPSPTVAPTPTPSTPTPTPSTPTPTPSTPTPTPSTPTPTPPPTPTPTPPPGTQTVNYNSATNGNWSDPQVWTPGVVPNNDHAGNTYSVVISGGSLVQDITSGVVIEELFMNAGTLRLDYPLTLNSGLNYSGGAINSGTLFIAGLSKQSAPMSAAGLTINNNSSYDILFDDSNVFSSSASVFNNGGALRKITGNGAVTFNAPLNNSGTVFVQSGTLRLTGGGSSSGIFATANNALLDVASHFTFTNGASFNAGAQVQIANGQNADISGTIRNDGNLRINSAGSFTDLILAGDVTLNGGGALTLVNAARVRGSGILTNNSIIEGETSNSGGLGANEIGIVNGVAGVIDASSSGLALNVDPNSADGLMNHGLMQATSGGILLLNGNGGGAFANASGTILANDGAEVQLANGATIIGGLLLSNGSGVIRTLNTAALDSVTNVGSFRISNGTNLSLRGTIENAGTITLNSAGSFTDLILDGDVTLQGGGVLQLMNAARVRGSGTLFNGGTSGQLHAIQGETSNSGSLGANEIGIVNRSAGVIEATISGLVLDLDPNAAVGLTNQGTMRASGGGILRLNGNGGGAFDNNGGVISALDASEVDLVNDAAITGGTLNTSGNGTFHVVNSAFLTSLTNAGAFNINNGAHLTLIGTITNSGHLALASAGSFTDLLINGPVVLIGGGSLNLTNAARVRGSGTLFNGGANGEAHIIQGETSNSGSLGANEIGLVNRSGGVIDANVNTLALVVDPAANLDMVNLGLMRASSGGILLLTGNGGGLFSNTGGVIQAEIGSEVQLVSGASLTGGDLRTVGTSVIRNINTASLRDLTIAGTFIANNAATTTFVGTINNTGSISIDSTGSFTDLLLDGDVTLTGAGTVTLSSADRVRAGTGSPRLTNVDNTIRGETSNSGSLGANEIAVTNRSLIDANVNGAVFLIDPANVANAFVNETGGLLRATNGGILRLTGNGGGAFGNNGSVIAFDLSQVQLSDGVSVSGGLWQTQGTGVIRVTNSATLANLTLGANFIANNGTTTTIAGTITNNGNITIDAQGSFTDLLLSGNLTLNGSGRLFLKNADRVRGSGILTNASIIQGETSNSGSLGANEIGIINQASGVIDAISNGLILNLDPESGNGLTNQGLLRARDGGILLLSGNGGGAFNNTGTMSAIDGGTLRFDGTVSSSGSVQVVNANVTATGSYTQTAGTFLLTDGTVQSTNALIFQGGLLDARGTINAAIQNNATLRPALGGSGLQVNGNVSLLGASSLVFQLGGLSQGSQYGFINVNGNVALGGNLVLSFVNNFQNTVSSADTFTVLSSTAPLTGVFANIASGSRLTTTDASGSFVVTYSGNNVVLSAYDTGGVRPASVQSAQARPAKTVLAASSDLAAAGVGRRVGVLGRISRIGSGKDDLPPARGPRVGGRERKPQLFAINLESSNRLQDLLDGAEPTSEKGKVRVNANRAAKNSRGSESRNRNNMGAHPSRSNPEAESRGRPVESATDRPAPVRILPLARRTD